MQRGNRVRKVLVTMNMPLFAGKRKLEGILDHVGRSGRRWELLLLPANKDFTAQTLRRARMEGVDGLVLLNFPSRALVRRVCESGIPAIIEGAAETDEWPDRVIRLELDVRRLVRMAVKHFAGQHVFRSFGFVQKPGNCKWSIDRESVFRAEITALGHEFSSCPCASPMLERWLRGLKKPAAVLAANDETALVVASAAEKANINIPDELALLGMDNDPELCERHGIDSIAIAFTEAGRLSADALERIMHGKKPHKKTIWYGASGIVSRGSSVSPKPTFELVRKALAFIDGHICGGIVVDDVVRHLQVSRRLADLRFRETLGGTIFSFILERRIAEVKRLLRDTDLPIAAISSKMGIASANHLKNVFRREVGTSMREFRSMAKTEQPRQRATGADVARARTRPLSPTAQ